MPPDNNDPYPYSFDDSQQPAPRRTQPPPQQPQRRRKNEEEDESVGEEILDEIDDALGISNRVFGCGWWLLTLPIRMISKIFGFIGDIFD